MNILAIDPSIRSLGVAFFYQRRLVVAGTVRCKAEKGVSNGRRAVDMASAVIVWLDELGVDFSANPPELVYEWPQIYAARKSKGNPNGLIKTVSPALVLSGMLATSKITTPTPAEWAGQTKKTTAGDPWASQRGNMVARRLHEAERLLVPDSHDAIDAVGLGLWACGRFERRRVNYGATPG